VDGQFAGAPLLLLHTVGANPLPAPAGTASAEPNRVSATPRTSWSAVG
jgi:hypothetical protein